MAIPVFGMSGTLLELLGANHVHRVAFESPGLTGAGAMSGWVDVRRAGSATTAPHVHSHAGFARHHHDRDDASVIALDGGALQGDASDDGGAFAGSLLHVMAMTDATTLAQPSGVRLAWLHAASAAAMPWASEGPRRPPKA